MDYNPREVINVVAMAIFSLSVLIFYIYCVFKFKTLERGKKGEKVKIFIFDPLDIPAWGLLLSFTVFFSYWLYYDFYIVGDIYFGKAYFLFCFVGFPLIVHSFFLLLYRRINLKYANCPYCDKSTLLIDTWQCYWCNTVQPEPISFKSPCRECGRLQKSAYCEHCKREFLL